MIKTSDDSVLIHLDRIVELFKGQVTVAQLRMWFARKHFDARRDEPSTFSFNPDQLLRLVLLVHLRKRGFRGKVAKGIGRYVCELLAEADELERDTGKLTTVLLLATPERVTAASYVDADPDDLKRAAGLSMVATGGEIFDCSALRAHVLKGFGPSKEAGFEEFQEFKMSA